jgi:hypothetical protein
MLEGATQQQGRKPKTQVAYEPDAELAAIVKCMDVLRDLEPDAQARAASYLAERHRPGPRPVPDRRRL